MLEILLIALALAMDCFAVSVVSGVIVRRPSPRTMLPLSFDFGFFQALMPLLGWFLTIKFQSFIQAWDHWIAFAMLAMIGGKMIVDAFREEDEKSMRPEKTPTRIALAIATSIDALAIGITFACTGYESAAQLTLPLVTIGIVSFLMSIAGFLLGVRFGDIVNKRVRPELVGGIILICIGLKVLLEHLLQ